jgi:hypothetical protein
MGRCYEGEGEEMREKIAEIIKPYLFLNYKDAYSISYDVEEIADKVLALLPSLEGIEVVEKCDYCKDWTKISANCPYCHGTGEITRQAEWGDIDVRNNINECGFILDRVEKLKSQLGYVGEDWLEDITKAVLQMLTTKSGGRLRVKE